MSRGFVKEDDQEEIPIVPPRADLPAGVVNYVTPEGIKELQEEKEILLAERDNLDTANEQDRRISLNHINAKLQLLNERIASAKVVNLEDQPQDEIRFGAHVKFTIKSYKKVQEFQIVGVDEADITKGKISFLSPLAQVLINKKVGDTAILKRPNDHITYEIMDISY